MRKNFIIFCTLVLTMAVQTEDSTEVVPAGKDIILFDGKTMSSWVGDTSAYRIVDGVLINEKRGVIFSEQEYSNFEISFDFRIEKAGNNGLLLRVDSRGKQNPVNAIEIQLSDHTAPNNCNPYNVTGSLFGILKPRKNVTKIGTWNTMRVRLEGYQLTTWINNVEVMNTDISLVNRSYFRNKCGSVGLFGWRGVTSFRNIKILPLNDSPSELFDCSGDVCIPCGKR